MYKKSILVILILSVLNSCDNQSESPNIIMMIGDGMGISQVSTSMYSNDNYTPLERSEYIGLSKTHAINDLIGIKMWKKAMNPCSNRSAN